MQKQQHILWWLRSCSFIDFFVHPVSLEEFPDYANIIAEPMDLTTLSQKNEDWNDFERSLRLIWSNAMTYNASTSDVYTVAANIQKALDNKLIATQQSTVQEFKKLCFVYGPLLNSLSNFECDGFFVAEPFLHPIDYIACGINEFDYKFKIAKEISIEDVQNALYEQQYPTCEDIEHDVILIFDNAIAFNGAESFIGKCASAMKLHAQKLFASCRSDVEKKFIVTPQSRYQLSQLLSLTKSADNLKLFNILRSKCPACISDTFGETVIDIDAMNFDTFYQVYQFVQAKSIRQDAC